MPSLNALRAFEAAARHGSFKAAAAELSVSQSAISHQVKALEAALGVRLFVRKVRHVELTSNGLTYFPVLRDAFRRIADATRVIVELHTEDIITVQSYSTFTIRWLIPRIPSFEKSNPDLRLRLNTAQTDVDFRNTDVDACILIGKPDRPDLHFSHLFACEMFPLCSPGYLQEHGPIELPQELHKNSLLQVYPSANDWTVWLHANEVTGVNLNDGPQFDSYDLALSGALQGLGIALGQQPYVASDLQSGMLVEIFPGRRIENPGEWYLVCRRESDGHEKISKFREWIRSEIAADKSLMHLTRAAPE